ncbi:MAG TPA: DUF4416 domain-containing protein [Nitrospiraceae bacterium]|nr:DUF4416 domain-containing protein [Nitrospiraceae bacterium]
MGKILEPHPVKLFIGMLSQDISLIEQLTDDLCNIFGPIDLSSPVLPWEHTRYYEKEMGTGMKRKFVFFITLIPPGEIAGIKIKTIGLEKRYLNESGGRKINLDPGYLDAAKIVLVSTKDFSHRIYLEQGIYGEVTLIFSGKDYHVLPYTFPDYRTSEYQRIFKAARELFKTGMKIYLKPDQ